MQSELCPAARFRLRFSAFSRVIEKHGLLQHPKPKSSFWKSTRQRKADVALLGCGEAGLGRSRGRTGSSSNSGYCNPQPYRSSKTIAGLMHTLDDVRDTAQTDCAVWARGSKGFREQRDSKGNSFVKNAQHRKPHIHSPSWGALHPVMLLNKRPQRNLNTSFTDTNHEDMQIGVLGFIAANRTLQGN